MAVTIFRLSIAIREGLIETEFEECFMVWGLP